MIQGKARQTGLPGGDGQEELVIADGQVRLPASDQIADAAAHLRRAGHAGDDVAGGASHRHALVAVHDPQDGYFQHGGVFTEPRRHGVAPDEMKLAFGQTAGDGGHPGNVSAGVAGQAVQDSCHES